MASRAADRGPGGSVNQPRGGSALGAAKLLALLVPGALLAGAYGSQYVGGLAPCDMCYWQRYAHWAALALAAGSFLLVKMPDRGRSLVWLAALAILISGGIGAYHAGVEAGIFQGFTACSSTCPPGPDFLKCLTNKPLISCTDVQWVDPVLGISMAGWNAIISVLAALVIGWLSVKRPRNPALA